RLFFNSYLKEKVSGFTSISPRHSLSSQTDTLSRLNACRYPYFQRLYISCRRILQAENFFTAKSRLLKTDRYRSSHVGSLPRTLPSKVLSTKASSESSS